jgi:exosortase
MRELLDIALSEVQVLWKKTLALPREAQGRLVLFAFMLFFVVLSYSYTLSITWDSWARPEYEFARLIPVLAIVVLWFWRQPIVISSFLEQIAGVAIVLISTTIRYLALHQYGMQQFMHYSLISSLIGLVMILGGLSMLKWTWPSILLLFLAIPFSEKMERYTFQKLQNFSTKCSIYALETVGVDVVTKPNSNEISLRRNNELVQLNVAEACAGFKGMLTTTAITLTVVLLIEADLWIKILLVLTSPIIALLANIVRIVLQSLCYQFSEDVAKIFHDHIAGFVVYPLIFGLLYLEYVILRNLVLDDNQELSLPQSPTNNMRLKVPQALTVAQPVKR